MQLTLSEMESIFDVLMDSKRQKELMDSLGTDDVHPDAWMLDYVYDSSLTNELEVLYEATQSARAAMDVLLEFDAEFVFNQNAIAAGGKKLPTEKLTKGQTWRKQSNVNSRFVPFPSSMS